MMHLQALRQYGLKLLLDTSWMLISRYRDGTIIRQHAYNNKMVHAQLFLFIIQICRYVLCIS